ncbi:MAG: hypothetical protein IKR80_06745 [Spirochaetales bacterium]|nr:hypothetical protein [Spirochaetales bacterium]
MYYILFNPKASGNKGTQKAKELEGILKDAELVFRSVLEIDNYKNFISSLTEDDKIVVVGGDGTLNRFINDIRGLKVTNDIYYYPAGTGNDFLRDLGLEGKVGPHKINKYLEDLPRVIVDGKDWLFLNGVGYGIDGYCCEEADKLHAAGQIDINYTSIAIKGLLGRFKPRNAKVSVDDKEYSFRNVWIAATMNGRYYGGGMKCAPAQDRLNPDRKVSLVIFRGRSKLATLAVFPSIFSGEHVKHIKRVMVFEGHDIRVEFDKPCALQIDGETVLNISSYEVKSARV